MTTLYIPVSKGFLGKMLLFLLKAMFLCLGLQRTRMVKSGQGRELLVLGQETCLLLAHTCVAFRTLPAKPCLARIARYKHSSLLLTFAYCHCV